MLDFGFYNMDCMEGMKQFPDKYFELAIVDPPYGGAGAPVDETFNGSISGGFGGWFKDYFNGDKRGHMCGGHAKKYNYASWDVAPDETYFKELFRVSKNQIIWGGNYFNLPSTRCFLIWRKTNVPENFSMAMCEYAWASFNDNAKMFEFSAVGQPGRFHPTQKPIELYEWILRNYAHEGDKILDTHVGSASSLIACQRLGFDFVGFEIDSTYYQLASERFERETAQMTLANYLKGLKST